MTLCRGLYTGKLKSIGIHTLHRMCMAKVHGLICGQMHNGMSGAPDALDSVVTVTTAQGL